MYIYIYVYIYIYIGISEHKNQRTDLLCFIINFFALFRRIFAYKKIENFFAR